MDGLKNLGVLSDFTTANSPTRNASASWKFGYCPFSLFSFQTSNNKKIIFSVPKKFSVELPKFRKFHNHYLTGVTLVLLETFHLLFINGKFRSFEMIIFFLRIVIFHPLVQLIDSIGKISQPENVSTHWNLMSKVRIFRSYKMVRFTSIAISLMRAVRVWAHSWKIQCNYYNRFEAISQHSGLIFVRRKLHHQNGIGEILDLSLHWRNWPFHRQHSYFSRPEHLPNMDIQFVKCSTDVRQSLWSRFVFGNVKKHSNYSSSSKILSSAVSHQLLEFGMPNRNC